MTEPTLTPTARPVRIRTGQRVTAVGAIKCGRCGTDLMTPAVITDPRTLTVAISFQPGAVACPFCQGRPS